MGFDGFGGCWGELREGTEVVCRHLVRTEMISRGYQGVEETSRRVCMSKTSGIRRLPKNEMGGRNEQIILIRENDFLTSLLRRDM